MIVRIVKMSFKQEHINLFISIFEESKHKIEAMEGNLHVELLQDKKEINTFFTYSHSKGEENLIQYRKSDKFTKICPKTKALFLKDAAVWTTEIKG